MQLLIAVLGVLGAALPIGGVLRFYVRTRREANRRRGLIAERGSPKVTYGDVGEAVRVFFDFDATLRSARLDLALVCTGFALSAAASIIAALRY